MLGFAASEQPKACWNAFAVGVAMKFATMVFEGGRDFQTPKIWRDLVNSVLGLWLMLSPWILGFETRIAARNSTVVAGILWPGSHYGR